MFAVTGAWSVTYLSGMVAIIFPNPVTIGFTALAATSGLIASGLNFKDSIKIKCKKPITFINICLMAQFF